MKTEKQLLIKLAIGTGLTMFGLGMIMGLTLCADVSVTVMTIIAVIFGLSLGAVVTIVWMRLRAFRG